jgi:hypothetical protein
MSNSGRLHEVMGTMDSDEPDDFPGRPFSLLLFLPRRDSHARPRAGEAKFWLEPRIELARNYGLSMRQVNAALRLIQEHEDEIRKAWKAHFGR